MGDGMRPLIAVTTSEMRGVDGHKQTPHGEPPRKELALGLSYPGSVERRAASRWWSRRWTSTPSIPCCARSRRVCLSGGPDLDPSLYGAELHPDAGPIDPEVDRFEVELARHADSLGLPVLAICRGAQTLNVARGGTLHQHLDDHRQTEPGTEVTHAVDHRGRQPPRRR